MDSVRRDAWTHGANGASRGRGRRFPLGALILRYFAYVLVALLALALVAYAAFGVLVGSGTVLLANYGDTALDETSARLGELTSADADAIDAAVGVPMGAACRTARMRWRRVKWARSTMPARPRLTAWPSIMRRSA